MAAVDRIEAKTAPDVTNDEPAETRYLHFPRSEEVNGVDGKPMLNRYSTYITREHDFPGAQVTYPQPMLTQHSRPSHFYENPTH
jgi:hypothetical protein